MERSIVEFRSRLLCNEYDESKCSIMVSNLIGSKGIYDNLGVEDLTPGELKYKMEAVLR